MKFVDRDRSPRQPLAQRFAERGRRVDRHHLNTLAPRRRTLRQPATYRRRLKVEQVISDLKDGPLAHAPSGKFLANAAWLALATITFNLTRAAATLASETLGRARTAIIRRTLINIAARIANQARRWLLHLPADCLATTTGFPVLVDFHAAWP